MKSMLATKYDKAQVKFPCFVQPKYDGANSYKWAVDTVCENFPECNSNELESILNKYI